MAIFRAGPIVGAISGALGGVVFANSRAGIIVRTRGVRTGTESKSLSTAQGMLGRVVAGWNALTTAQRAAWNNKAATTPLPNRLGVARALTGFQFYSMFVMDIYLGVPPASLTPPAQSLLYAPSYVSANFLAGGPYILTSRGLPWPTSTPTEFAFVQRSRRATQISGFTRGIRISSWSHPLGSKDAYALSAAAGVELFAGQPFAAGVSWQVGGGYMGVKVLDAGTVDDVPWTTEDFESNSLAPYTGDTGSFSVSAGAAKTGTYGLQASFTAAGSTTKSIVSTSGLPVYPVRGCVFECWIQLVNATTERAQIYFGYADSSNFYRFILRSNAIAGLQKVLAGVVTNVALGSVVGFVTGAWYRLVCDWGYAGTMRVRVFDAAGVSKMDTSASDTSHSGGGIGFSAINVAGSAALAYWDGWSITGRAA